MCRMNLVDTRSRNLVGTAASNVSLDENMITDQKTPAEGARSVRRRSRADSIGTLLRLGRENGKNKTYFLVSFVPG